MPIYVISAIKCLKGGLMAIIKNIPGIMWAADILTGRKPIPSHKPKEKEKEEFKDLLDSEIEKLKKKEN